MARVLQPITERSRAFVLLLYYLTFDGEHGQLKTVENTICMYFLKFSLVVFMVAVCENRIMSSSKKGVTLCIIYVFQSGSRILRSKQTGNHTSGIKYRVDCDKEGCQIY